MLIFLFAFHILSVHILNNNNLVTEEKQKLPTVIRKLSPKLQFLSSSVVMSYRRVSLYGEYMIEFHFCIFNS